MSMSAHLSTNQSLFLFLMQNNFNVISLGLKLISLLLQILGLGVEKDENCNQTWKECINLVKKKKSAVNQHAKVNVTLMFTAVSRQKS